MIGLLTLALWTLAVNAAAQPPLPHLTGPVNDFAKVIDPASAAELDRMIEALQRATGDVLVVATIETYAPYAEIREYAVKLFENHGRGIGQAGKDNGVLVLVAIRDRQAWIEVGYGLEEFITDGFAGETTRLAMIPAFRRGDYGAGLVAGVQRIIGRIAERRNVKLEGVPEVGTAPTGTGDRWTLIVILFIIVCIALVILSSLAPSSVHRKRRRS